MELEDARRIAEIFIEKVKGQCHRIEIVGSIRRGRPMINDVDIVAIPKNPRTFLAGIKADQRGEKIIRFEYLGAQLDVYIARAETFEVIRLIRTGSAAHNVKLAMLARKKGWQLKFDHGLVTDKGEIRTEAGILEALLGRVPEPRERE
jgi:DNA polymerase/3'-5' exonuclease PolX